MRILLFPNSYAPVLGGLQTVVAMLARGLRDRGHEVRVVTNRYPRTLPAHEILGGIPVDRWLFVRPAGRQLRQKRWLLFGAAFYYYFDSLVRLARLVRSFRPDVINVHFPDAQMPFVTQLRQWYGRRLVVSLHGHDIERFTGPERGRVPIGDRVRLTTFLRRADAVTACSAYLLERAGQLEPSVQAKGVAVHNGVDLERFADPQAHVHERPYLFAFGRLVRVKGFDLLLEAFAQVEPPSTGLDLMLAGEGEEGTALRALSEQLGIAHRVHFLGRATPKQVVHLLNGCRFAVVPSRCESFGITALEIMAAGKLMLATKVGGVLECLQQVAPEGMPLSGSPVLLVEPTVEGLAAGLRHWRDGRGLVPADQKLADTLIRQKFSWRRVTEQYEEILAGTVQTG